MHEVNARALDYGAFTLNSIGRESLQSVAGENAQGFPGPSDGSANKLWWRPVCEPTYIGEFSSLREMAREEHCPPRSKPVAAYCLQRYTKRLAPTQVHRRRTHPGCAASGTGSGAATHPLGPVPHHCRWRLCRTLQFL